MRRVWRPSTPGARRVRYAEIGLTVAVLVAVLAVGPRSGSAAADELVTAGLPVGGVAVGLDADGVIVLDNGLRVQMLGVTLPEPGDPEIVVQTAERTLADAIRGQRLELEFDPILPAEMQQGRPTQVGYVWLVDEAGGRRGMLNALVLAYGFARPVERLRYRYSARFIEAARLAQSRRLGVWMPS